MPVWALLLFTALLAAAAFVFAPSAKQVRDYIGLPLYADALAHRYSPAVASRLDHGFTTLELRGGDMRRVLSGA